MNKDKEDLKIFAEELHRLTLDRIDRCGVGYQSHATVVELLSNYFGGVVYGDMKLSDKKVRQIEEDIMNKVDNDYIREIMKSHRGHMLRMMKKSIKKR